MAIDPRTNADSGEQDVVGSVGGEDKLWVGGQICEKK